MCYYHKNTRKQHFGRHTVFAQQQYLLCKGNTIDFVQSIMFYEEICILIRMDCLLRNGYLRTKQTAGCKYAILGKYIVIFFLLPQDGYTLQKGREGDTSGQSLLLFFQVSYTPPCVTAVTVLASQKVEIDNRWINPKSALDCYALMKPSFCLFRYFSVTMEPFR